MRVIYSEKSLKSLKKLDKPIQKMIIHYMEKVGQLEEPRARGKALSANLRGFWRYRVSNYRIICEIDDDKLIICVVDVDHRKNIYKCWKKLFVVRALILQITFLFAKIKESYLHTKKATQCGFNYSFMNKLGAV